MPLHNGFVFCISCDYATQHGHYEIKLLHQLGVSKMHLVTEVLPCWSVSRKGIIVKEMEHTAWQEAEISKISPPVRPVLVQGPIGRVPWFSCRGAHALTFPSCLPSAQAAALDGWLSAMCHYGAERKVKFSVS